MPRQLTQDELDAVQAFAKAHGRRWKSELTDVYWYNARIWNGRNELHALRNDPRFGHEGLEAFKLPKANRHGYNPVAVNQAIEASNRAGRRIGGQEARAIHALLAGRS